MSIHTKEVFSFFQPDWILELPEGEALINRITPVEKSEKAFKEKE